MKRPYHWLKRTLLGLDPDEPANDRASLLFIGTTIFQALIAVFAVLALFPEKNYVTYAGLALSWVVYEGFLTIFGFYNAVYQPEERKRAARENRHRSPSEQTKRAGEKIGASFIVFVAIILPLTAAVLEAMGFHTEAHEIPLWAAVTTIIVMSETSIYKSKHESKKQLTGRGVHNKILFDLSVLTQATVVVLIVMRSIWGISFSLHMFLVLGAALLWYTRHNWELKKRYPNIPQRGWGHIMAYFVVVFTGAMIFVTETPGLHTYLPWLTIFKMLPVTEIFLLCGITATMVFGSAPLENWARKLNGGD